MIPLCVTMTVCQLCWVCLEKKNRNIWITTLLMFPIMSLRLRDVFVKPDLSMLSSIHVWFCLPGQIPSKHLLVIICSDKKLLYFCGSTPIGYYDIYYLTFDTYHDALISWLTTIFIRSSCGLLGGLIECTDPGMCNSQYTYINNMSWFPLSNVAVLFLICYCPTLIYVYLEINQLKLVQCYAI